MNKVKNYNNVSILFFEISNATSTIEKRSFLIRSYFFRYFCQPMRRVNLRTKNG